MFQDTVRLASQEHHLIIASQLVDASIFLFLLACLGSIFQNIIAIIFFLCNFVTFLNVIEILVKKLKSEIYFQHQGLTCLSC